MKKKVTFDSLFLDACGKLGWLGKQVSKRYLKNALFARFVKFSVSSFFIYWIVRAPMLILFEFALADVYIPIFPFVTFIVVVIPAYVISAFVVGIVLSLVAFVVNEGWIWKND